MTLQLTCIMSSKGNTLQESIYATNMPLFMILVYKCPAQLLTVAVVAAGLPLRLLAIRPLTVIDVGS